MRIQFLSDLHLERRPKETFEFLVEHQDTAPALALLGDIAPIDHPNLRPFLEWCSERWETVFYVPGIQELLGHEGATVEEIPATVNKLKAICSTYKNIHVLYRDAFFTEDGLVVLGCTFWGPLSEQPREFRELHRTDLDWIKKMIRQYRNPFCILSHYPPVSWLQDEDELLEPLDAPVVPEIELLLRHPIVTWIFGHYHGFIQTFKLWNTPTGQTREITLVCNGLGTGDTWSSRRAFDRGYRRDAVLRVDPAVFYREVMTQRDFNHHM